MRTLIDPADARPGQMIIAGAMNTPFLVVDVFETGWPGPAPQTGLRGSRFIMAECRFGRQATVYPDSDIELLDAEETAFWDGQCKG